ncbi:MAG TPA: PspC domain-containing protein [Arachnia sp.]|nr:PspC domain-containing protein [Arachnia sp.]HMT85595.1 PspC domain-containing protein [Arachnia sp.]
MQESRSLIGWVDPRLEGLRRPIQPGRTPGLCRAISHATGLDLTLVRALFVLLTLSTGIGIMLYGWGTVLSAGPDGRRPVDSLLPAFAQWSLKAQALVVAISSLVFVFTFGQMAPLNFVVAVVILVLLYAATSTARSRPMPPPPPPGTAPPTAPTEARTAAERARTIGEWRAAMQQSANRPVASLPELDLYGVQPEPGPAPEAAKPKTSWGAAAIILLVGGLAFAAIGVLGAGLTFSLGVAAAVMGALTLIIALAARQVRIPRLALGVIAAFAGAAVLVPTMGSSPVSYDAPAYEDEFAAPLLDENESGGVIADHTPLLFDIEPGSTDPIDLTALDLTGYTVDDPLIVQVVGANSALTLELPGLVRSITVNDESLEWNEGDGVLPIEVEVYGNNLHVGWETP